MDGSLLKQFSKAACYLSLDIIYYTKSDNNELAYLAKFLYAENASAKIKAAEAKKKKGSLTKVINIMTLTGKKAKKNFTPADLVENLDGKSCETGIFDAQFLQNVLREKSSGLTRFWYQQMEILKGSKNSVALILSLSDVSKAIKTLCGNISNLLKEFDATQGQDFEVIEP